MLGFWVISVSSCPLNCIMLSMVCAVGYYVSPWNIDFSMFGPGNHSGRATTRAASITDMRLLNQMNHVGALKFRKYQNGCRY